MQKVGRIELACGKSQSGFKYQSESESIKVDVWKDVEKVGRVELAWGKSQSGFKYQNESESKSESESIKVDVWKDVHCAEGGTDRARLGKV